MERKGKYKYSQEELDRNKIIKMQQDELQKLQQRSELLKTATDMLNADCKSQDQELSELYHKSEELRVKALKLAKEKGLNPVKILNPITKPERVDDIDNTDFLTDDKISLSEIPAWSDM